MRRSAPITRFGSSCSPAPAAASAPASTCGASARACPTPPRPPSTAFGSRRRWPALPLALRALPQPVIAAVNGPAVGGGLALCLAADVRLCSTSASFGNAAILIGLSGAEMGMSYHLPRIVGTSVAADWMLTGRTVSAEEAYRRGLVSELVDDDQLLDRALELAAQIAANSPLGVQLTKRALQVNTDAPDLAAALEVENRNQVIARATRRLPPRGRSGRADERVRSVRGVRAGPAPGFVRRRRGARARGRHRRDRCRRRRRGRDRRRRGGADPRRRGCPRVELHGSRGHPPADDGTAPLDELARRLDIAAHLGAPGALVGTGPLGALPAAHADAICRDWLVRAGPLAADRERADHARADASPDAAMVVRAHTARRADIGRRHRRCRRRRRLRTRLVGARTRSADPPSTWARSCRCR